MEFHGRESRESWLGLHCMRANALFCPSHSRR